MHHHTEPMTPMQNAEIERPSQDHSDRFVTDEQIRQAGYEIIARPKTGPVMWGLKGDKMSAENRVKFTQTQIIELEKL